MDDLHDRTASARQGASRYLRELAPSKDLQESFDRLKQRANCEQQEYSVECLTHQLLQSMNLVSFRLVWEICQLSQVMFWEHDPKYLLGVDVDSPIDSLRVEAHQRILIMASRLAREGGWPIKDPLVPSREDELEDLVPWRDAKLKKTESAIELFLDETNARCDCGARWRYVAHRLTSELVVLVRCSRGHESSVELDVRSLQSSNS